MLKLSKALQIAKVVRLELTQKLRQEIFTSRKEFYRKNIEMDKIYKAKKEYKLSQIIPNMLGEDTNA